MNTDDNKPTSSANDADGNQFTPVEKKNVSTSQTEGSRAQQRNNRKGKKPGYLRGKPLTGGVFVRGAVLGETSWGIIANIEQDLPLLRANALFADRASGNTQTNTDAPLPESKTPSNEQQAAQNLTQPEPQENHQKIIPNELQRGGIQYMGGIESGQLFPRPPQISSPELPTAPIKPDYHQAGYEPDSNKPLIVAIRHDSQPASDTPRVELEQTLTPAKPSDPEEPTEPTTSVGPTEPNDSTTSVDPTEPSDPTSPVDPTDSNDPTSPADPTQPTGPTLVSATDPQTGHVVEDDPNQATATGNVFTTPQTNMFSSQQLAGQFGVLEVSANGYWLYVLDNSLVSTQQLSANTLVSEMFTLIASDGSSHQITINVQGTNDTPAITQIAAQYQQEDGVILSGKIAASDIDSGDSLTFSNSQPVAGFTLNPDGSYQFDASDSAYNHLAVGNSALLRIPVTVTDNAGASVIQILEITVNGTNDLPVVVATPLQQVDEDSLVHGQMVAFDPDDNDILSYTLPAPVAGLTLNNDGSYTFDAANTAYQSLHQGEVLDLIIPVHVTDAVGDSVQSQIHIHITGTNDIPIVAGIDHAIGSLSAAQSGRINISGQLSVLDLDSHESGFQPQLLQGSFGVLSISSDGQWHYTADASQRALLGLQGSQHLPEQFQVLTTDGTRHDINIEIHGHNQPAAIGGVTSGFLKEDSQAQCQGHMSITDPNAGEAEFSPQDIATTHGHFTLNTLGDWTFTLDNQHPDIQALPANSAVTERITVGSVDGTPQVISINIVGTNDVPVIVGSSTANISEDNSATTVSGDLTGTDIDLGAHLQWQVDGSDSGNFGSLSIDADSGHWTYTLDNSLPATQQLAASESQTESFTVSVTDENGATTTQTIIISVSGSNDAPVIASKSVLTGAVTEDATQTRVNGQLVASDIDANAQLHWQIDGSANGHYGALTLDGATGQWTYTLDNSLGATQQLSAGQSEQESFQVSVMDDNGAATQQSITITVNGQNDQAVIGGVDSAAVREDSQLNAGLLQASGSLTISDSDAGESQFVPFAGIDGDNGYGKFSLDTNGNWTYQADNQQTAIQQLGANSPALTDSVAVVSTDGSSHTISVSILGTNDVPVIQGDSQATTPDDDTSISGQLTITDTDAGEALFQAQTGIQGTYGTLDIAADGFWQYTPSGKADNIKLGSTEQDIFTVLTEDGTAHTVTVNLTGSAEYTLQGDTVGSAQEDVLTALSGDIEILNEMGAPVIPQFGDQVLFGLYGTLDLSDQGHWEYTLDNAAASVQGLKSGELVEERFHLTMPDGTSRAVVINITGSDDAPKISTKQGPSPTLGNVVEDDASYQVLSGQMQATDADTGDIPVFTAQTATAGHYGTFTIDADGNWQYTLDNSNPATNALAAGQVAHESFTVEVTTNRGEVTRQNVQVTVTGSNDAPILTSPPIQVVNEDDAVINGQLTATEIDNGDTLTFSLANQVAGLTLDADGHYQFDPSDAAYQQLAENAQQTLTIPVQVTDSSGSQANTKLVITLYGTNDIPRASATAVNVNEGDAIIQGAIQGTDADSGDSLTFSTSSTIAGLTLNPDGSWIFDPSDPSYQTIGAGDVLDLQIPITVADNQGATSNSLLSIQITGTNAIPTVIATTAAPADLGTSLEDAAVVYTQAELLTLVGAKDSDTIDTLSVVNMNSPHGTFSQQANGNWLFNPEADFSGRNVPVELQVSDGQATTTAYGKVNISPVTDPSKPDIILTSKQEVINTGDPSSLGRIQIDKVTSNVDDGFTLEINLLAKPVADTNSYVGPVFLNMGYPGNNNFLTLWNPGSVKIGGMNEAATGLNLGDGNAHRLTMTWEASSGQYALYDNGQELHSQIWHQGQPLPDDLYIIIGGKNHASPGIGGFQEGEHFEGDVFNVAMTHHVLSAAEVRLAPLASQIDVNNGLDMDIRSVGGQITDVTANHQISAHGAIGTNTGVDTSLNTPPPGSVLHLELNAPQPSDPDDSVSAVQLSGFLAGTVLSDGSNTYTVNAPSDEIDVMSWQLDGITAILPAGVSENMQLKLTVETTGPAGSISSTYQEPVILNPSLPLPSAIITGTDTASTDEDTVVSGSLQVTDNDPGESLFIAEQIHGNFGELDISEDGRWIYTPNDQADALLPGATAQDGLIVKSVDGTTHLISISIDGKQDKAVISGVDSGTIIEDLTPMTSGKLNVSDADNGESRFVTDTVVRSTGTFEINEFGNWQFTADATSDELQQLADGEQRLETFTVKTFDGSTQDISVIINGTNDAPMLSHMIVDPEVDQGTTFTYAVPVDTFSDIDSADSLALTANGLPAWLSFDAASATFSGKPGISDAGITTITLSATDTQGAQVRTTFNLTVINTNNAPVMTPISTVKVDEDGAQVSGQILATDADNQDTQTFTTSATIDGFTLNADGNWTFDPSDAAYQALAAGQQQQLTIPVSVTDAAGLSDQQDLIITITGTNDAAKITGSSYQIIQEDSTFGAGALQSDLYCTGLLSVTDVDSGDASFAASSGTSDSGYGTFTISDAGVWQYQADNAQSAIQALGDGDKLTDTFSIATKDGTQHTITVEIWGTNDDPTVAHALTAMTTAESAAFSFTIPANTFTDVDAGTRLRYAAYGLPSWLNFDPVTGTFSGTPGDSDIGTATLTVSARDNEGGSVSTTFALTVDNVNNTPVLSPINTYTVDEDGSKLSGQFTATDADSGDTVTFATPAQVDGLTVNSDGSWTFDPSHSAYQSLAVGTLEDLNIPIQAVDSQGATATSFLHIQITGTNDQPTVSASVTLVNGTEDTELTLLASDLLANADDVDSGDLAQLHITALAADHGSIVDNHDGTYRYIPEPDYNGQVVFSYTVTDPQQSSVAQTATLSLAAVNDIAVVTGQQTGSVTEDTSLSHYGELTTRGTLFISDADAGEDQFVASNIVVGDQGLGQFKIDADGQWQYFGDNEHPRVQALNQGEQLVESTTITSADGTRFKLSVTINGIDESTATVIGTAVTTNTPAVFSGDDSVSLTEDDTSSASSILAAQGNLFVTDPDSGEDAFQASFQNTAYGTLQIYSNGYWVYQANNNQQAIQDLNTGETLTDDIIVYSEDKTSHRISITINGVDEVSASISASMSNVHVNTPATISGTDSGLVTEDKTTPVGSDMLESHGYLTISDPDFAEDAFIPKYQHTAYGTFQLYADGHWYYSADNTQQAIQELDSGEHLTDDIVVQSEDRTSHRVSIRIQGTDEAGPSTISMLPPAPQPDALTNVNEETEDNGFGAAEIHEDTAVTASNVGSAAEYLDIFSHAGADLKLADDLLIDISSEDDPLLFALNEEGANLSTQMSTSFSEVDMATATKLLEPQDKQDDASSVDNNAAQELVDDTPFDPSQDDPSQYQRDDHNQ